MARYLVTVETPHYKELIVDASDHRAARLAISGSPPDDVIVVDVYNPEPGFERIVGRVKRLAHTPGGSE